MSRSFEHFLLLFLLTIPLMICQSLKEVTKTSITTKESIEFYQVYNDNIKKNMESTVELQDNVENHLCNLCEYTTLNVSYLKRHTETCHEGVFYSCCQCDYKANMSHVWYGI